MHAVGWRAGANQRVGRSRRDPEFESRYLQRRVGNELFPALGAHDAVGRETTKETGALLLAIGGLAAAFGAALPRSLARATALKALARPLGLQVTVRLVSEAAELDGAFAASAADHDQGILFESGPVIFENLPRVIALAAQHRLPAIYERREMVESGGLLPTDRGSERISSAPLPLSTRSSKEPNPPSRRSSSRPGSNWSSTSRPAKALGLTVPPSILARADEVIE